MADVASCKPMASEQVTNSGTVLTNPTVKTGGVQTQPANMNPSPTQDYGADTDSKGGVTTSKSGGGHTNSHSGSSGS